LRRTGDEPPQPLTAAAVLEELMSRLLVDRGTEDDDVMTLCADEV